MERWRSSWRTPYPDAKEKLDDIKSNLHTAVVSLETINELQEDIVSKSSDLEIKLDYLRRLEAENHLRHWLSAIDRYEEEGKTPEQILEIIKDWAEFDKDSPNPYIKTVVKKMLEKITEK